MSFGDLARKHGKPFYCGGSYGMLGYVFCDLGRHEYLQPSKTSSELSKVEANYVPLHEALTYSWKGLNKRQTKELNPLAIFSVLAIWRYESGHRRLPDTVEAGKELVDIANLLIKAAEVNGQVLKEVPLEDMSSLAMMASHEFSPVCAVVGGTLGQDMLKALSAREPPIANFFSFDGITSLGTVCRMNMK